MTYFGFLARFVVLPMLILRLLIRRDETRDKPMPDALTNWPAIAVIGTHSALALTYTTIWDNYLVASNIWSYDPKLVTGVRLGWVPIEEYTFFVLQPLMTGSLWELMARRVQVEETAYDPDPTPRLAVTAAMGVAWLASIYKLLEGQKQNKYMSLILGWALPPLMLQMGFGGDILWRNRRLIAASLIPATAYLGIADSLAIGEGTWGINPEYTLKAEVIRNLPLEEFTFFLLTNTLLVCGVTLVLSKESERRLPPPLREAYFRLKDRLLGAKAAPVAPLDEPQAEGVRV
jgi:lycopene cyclase domain-containing protein